MRYTIQQIPPNSQSALPLIKKSSPLAQKRHQPRARGHRAHGAQHLPDGRALHVAAEHELVGHELDEARVDQDAGGDGVEDAVDDQRRLAAGRERLPDAEPDGDGDGGREGVAGAEEVGRPALGLGPVD